MKRLYDIESVNHTDLPGIVWLPEHPFCGGETQCCNLCQHSRLEDNEQNTWYCFLRHESVKGYYMCQHYEDHYNEY